MNNQHQIGDTIKALNEDYKIIKGFVLHADEFVLNPHMMFGVINERLENSLIFVGEFYTNKMAGYPRMVLLEKNKIWK